MRQIAGHAQETPILQAPVPIPQMMQSASPQATVRTVPLLPIHDEAPAVDSITATVAAQVPVAVTVELQVQPSAIDMHAPEGAAQPEAPPVVHRCAACLVVFKTRHLRNDHIRKYLQRASNKEQPLFRAHVAELRSVDPAVPAAQWAQTQWGKRLLSQFQL